MYVLIIVALSLLLAFLPMKQTPKIILAAVLVVFAVLFVMGVIPRFPVFVG